MQLVMLVYTSLILHKQPMNQVLVQKLQTKTLSSETMTKTKIETLSVRPRLPQGQKALF